MKIAVCGLGFMGATHLQGIARIPTLQLVAVADGNEARLSGDLSGIGGNLGIEGCRFDFTGVAKYTSLGAMLSDGSVEAVDICIPTNHHRDAAISALRAGKHVLVEKPMALEGADADAMCAEAERSGKILMVGQVLRFMPAYSKVAELVRSGRLGRVRSAIFRRRSAVPTWAPWEFDRARNGGGVFDLLVHDVDMCVHLFGVPQAISARGHENLAGGVDIVTAEFRSACADSITISGGWHHTGAYPFSMEYTVLADNGVVEFSSSGRPATVYWADRRAELLDSSGISTDAYQAEIEYFAGCCIAGSTPDRCPPRESAAAVRVARVMEQARARNGEWVELA